MTDALRPEVAVVGAGPAGLCAAASAAEAGAQVVLYDENATPGGQLFKQIHKFFGSEQHYAGVRGYEIGERLVARVCEADVDLRLNTAVFGVYAGLPKKSTNTPSTLSTSWSPSMPMASLLRRTLSIFLGVSSLNTTLSPIYERTSLMYASYL